jgi:hypothetical protein
MNHPSPTSMSRPIVGSLDQVRARCSSPRVAMRLLEMAAMHLLKHYPEMFEVLLTRAEQQVRAHNGAGNGSGHADTAG